MNIGKILKIAMEDGARLRMTLVGKQLKAIPELRQILKGIENPKVLLGANGRGLSGVFGMELKSGNESLIKLAGGLDRAKGKNPIFQLRERLLGGKAGTANAIFDMNKAPTMDNLAASFSSKKGIVTAAIDSAPLKYNGTSNINEYENFLNKFNIPQEVKGKLNEIFGQYEEFSNPRKGMQLMDELAQKFNGLLKNSAKNIKL